jgi:hypothetical protein
MTKEELKQVLQDDIHDEGVATVEYTQLANEMQAWVNTLPPQARANYQWMVNTVRFIAGDEARHKATLQDLVGRME